MVTQAPPEEKAKPLYPAWQAVFRSIYSVEFYRDVSHNWRGFGFLFLFLLIGLTWLPIAFRGHLLLNQVIENNVLPIVQQMPLLSAKDSKFQIDRPSPYMIKSGGQVLFTYDTTGATQQLQSFGWLVTDKEITLQNGGGVSKLLTTADQFDGRSISAKTLLDATNWIKKFLVPVLFVVVWPLSFFCCAVQSVIYAVVGRVFEKFWRADLPLKTLIRLSAVSLTPWLVIDLLLKLSNVMPVFNLLYDNGLNENFLKWGLLSGLITLGYLCLAVKVNGKF